MGLINRILEILYGSFVLVEGLDPKMKTNPELPEVPPVPETVKERYYSGSDQSLWTVVQRSILHSAWQHERVSG